MGLAPGFCVHELMLRNDSLCSTVVHSQFPTSNLVFSGEKLVYLEGKSDDNGCTTLLMIYLPLICPVVHAKVNLVQVLVKKNH